jgi:hypothetical protein
MADQFEEIGHSGGKIIFSIKTDSKGEGAFVSSKIQIKSPCTKGDGCDICFA